MKIITASKYDIMQVCRTSLSSYRSASTYQSMRAMSPASFLATPHHLMSSQRSASLYGEQKRCIFFTSCLLRHTDGFYGGNFQSTDKKHGFESVPRSRSEGKSTPHQQAEKSSAEKVDDSRFSESPSADTHYEDSHHTYKKQYQSVPIHDKKSRYDFESIGIVMAAGVFLIGAGYIVMSASRLRSRFRGQRQEPLIKETVPAKIDSPVVAAEVSKPTTKVVDSGVVAEESNSETSSRTSVTTPIDESSDTPQDEKNFRRDHIRQPLPKLKNAIPHDVPIPPQQKQPKQMYLPRPEGHMKEAGPIEKMQDANHLDYRNQHPIIEVKRRHKEFAEKTGGNWP